jgi:hypothetical protein
MKKWITSLYLSLFNNNEGFAGRKVTAAVLTTLVVVGDIIYFTKSETAFMSVFENWLIIHLCAIGFYLGLVTVANLIELRTGVRSEKTTEITTTETTKSESKSEHTS